MSIDKKIIIGFFRYLWVFLALVLILFIISKAFYTKRTLEYDLDFSQSVTKDIIGWYPESRLTNTSISSVAGAYDVVAEPLYMKIYTPINFNDMTITGSLQPHHSEDIRLGLRQLDGSWDFQPVILEEGVFSNNFYLENAQLKNNQLEIILSIPDLHEPNRVSIINNWKVILSR